MCFTLISFFLFNLLPYFPSVCVVSHTFRLQASFQGCQNASIDIPILGKMFQMVIFGFGQQHRRHMELLKAVELERHQRNGRGRQTWDQRLA